MRAIVCNAFGPVTDLALEEREQPTPGKGEVRIDVRAAGINFPDLLTVEGKYQFKPPLPFVPGVEVAGVVDEIGEDVSNVKVGDKVIATLQTGALLNACSNTSPLLARDSIVTSPLSGKKCLLRPLLDGSGKEFPLIFGNPLLRFIDAAFRLPPSSLAHPISR